MVVAIQNNKNESRNYHETNSKSFFPRGSVIDIRYRNGDRAGKDERRQVENRAKAKSEGAGAGTCAV